MTLVNSNLINILSRYSRNSSVVVNINSSLVNDLGLDSMDLLELVDELESTFLINIEDHEIPLYKNFGTIQNLSQFINDKITHSCK